VKLVALVLTLFFSGPQPARLAHVSQQVFGARARDAECIAHYESTDGAHLVNGVDLGPWQVDVRAHGWVDRNRILTDWLYAARVAYRISKRGTDWSPWPQTRILCGL
jgi:hypothetical protein